MADQWGCGCSEEWVWLMNGVWVIRRVGVADKWGCGRSEEWVWPMNGGVADQWGVARQKRVVANQWGCG